MADLHELLVQTKGTGVNVYTHGEMQPAHGYPKLKAFSHLVGNYGTAWQNQKVCTTRMHLTASFARLSFFLSSQILGFPFSLTLNVSRLTPTAV
jgi:hypothetical protein